MHSNRSSSTNTPLLSANISNGSIDSTLFQGSRSISFPRRHIVDGAYYAKRYYNGFNLFIGIINTGPPPNIISLIAVTTTVL